MLAFLSKQGPEWCEALNTLSAEAIVGAAPTRRADSEVPVKDLTGDLRASARDMERAKYPDGVTERPAPTRVLGKRREGDGRSVFLGSRWNEEGDSADGARASRRRY